MEELILKIKKDINQIDFDLKKNLNLYNKRFNYLRNKSYNTSLKLLSFLQKEREIFLSNKEILLNILNFLLKK
jgi:hypothetical protein